MNPPALLFYSLNPEFQVRGALGQQAQEEIKAEVIEPYTIDNGSLSNQESNTEDSITLAGDTHSLEPHF